jgi:hypothetical protein
MYGRHGRTDGWTGISELSLILRPKISDFSGFSLNFSDLIIALTALLSLLSPSVSVVWHPVAAVQFTSRNQVFNIKIDFPDCIAVAVPVKLKAWPPSPLLLGMVVLF